MRKTFRNGEALTIATMGCGVSSLQLKLQEQEFATEIARQDAENMRRSVVKLQDMADENKRLSREHRRMSAEVEELREELRLTRLVCDGKVELVELDKQRTENIYDTKISELEKKLQIAEANMMEAQRESRVQTEAALALLKQGSIPHGGLGGLIPPR